MFNDVIDSLNLREIVLSGCKFTWANSLLNPTYEKLDRVLVNTEWEEKNPLVTIQALSRDLSDHTPLLLDTGRGSNRCSQPLFRFELGWLLREDFRRVLTNCWTKEIRGATNIERWQNKIRRLRQFLRGWAKNISGAYRKEKMRLMTKADDLDKLAETRLLTSHELELKNSVKQALAQLLREEEIKWYQRAKTKKIVEGDRNTKYYHMIANGKHRKDKILQLEQEEGIIKGDVQLNKYITNYYKNLFGPPERNIFSMVETQKEDIPHVSAEENDLLTKEFLEEEVKMLSFKWNLIKPQDLMVFQRSFIKFSGS